MLWDVSGVIWSPNLPQDAESGLYWLPVQMSDQGFYLQVWLGIWVLMILGVRNQWWQESVCVFCYLE